MKSKILSLNVGGPAPMEWQGKSIVSSMRKSPVPFLNVHLYNIDGDSFAHTRVHGLPHSVLYIAGVKSFLEYMHLLGRDQYEPGSLGENITVDDFDEKKISVGDVFQIGEVVAQATFPRIPCSKLNTRMQHAEGQKLLQECGRSGIYFRILEPGKIFPNDSVERIEEAKVKFLISDIYAKALRHRPLTNEDRNRALSNGAFPEGMLEKWRTLID
ncbi:MAG: MOSC domain-containing protein [Bdellovibrionales bacterium]